MRSGRIGRGTPREKPWPWRRNGSGWPKIKLPVLNAGFEPGASAELEVLRAKSGLSSAQEALLNADVNHRNAERALRAAMRRPDLPLGQQGGLTPNTLPDPSVRSLDRESLVTMAKSERAEIAQHQGRLIEPARAT